MSKDDPKNKPELAESESNSVEPNLARPSDEGLSLEEINDGFQKLVEAGKDPYTKNPAEPETWVEKAAAEAEKLEQLDAKSTDSKSTPELDHATDDTEQESESHGEIESDIPDVSSTAAETDSSETKSTQSESSDVVSASTDLVSAKNADVDSVGKNSLSETIAETEPEAKDQSARPKKRRKKRKSQKKKAPKENANGANGAEFEVTPLRILEAILFVGTEDNSPLFADQIAGLMRGVKADEIELFVEELNEDYAATDSVFEIASEKGGFRMVLRDELSAVRNQFYGKVRDAQLSQMAIDVLSIVAYKQPISRDAVEKLRGRPIGGVLNQLVRRELLSLEKTEKEKGKRRQKVFRTTDRFLELFGLETIEDLPSSQRLDFVD